LPQKAPAPTIVEARPPKRAQRAGKGKSDLIDAHAHAAASSVLPKDTTELIRPRAGKLRSALRVLLTARRAMDAQRTADRNALTALVRIIDLGIDARKPLKGAPDRADGVLARPAQRRHRAGHRPRRGHPAGPQHDRVHVTCPLF